MKTAHRFILTVAGGILIGLVAGYGLVFQSKPAEGSGEAYLQAGNNSWELGNHDEAVSNYLRAYNRGLDNAEMFLALGKAYSDAPSVRNPKIAQKYFERATQADPRSAEAWTGYSQALGAQARDAESQQKALDAMERAISLGQGDGELMVAQIQLLLRMRKTEEAKEALARLEKEDPDHPKLDPLRRQMQAVGSRPPTQFGGPGRAGHEGHNH